MNTTGKIISNMSFSYTLYIDEARHGKGLEGLLKRYFK